MTNGLRRFMLGQQSLPPFVGPSLSRRELDEAVAELAAWRMSANTKFWLTLLAVPAGGARSASVMLAVYDANSNLNTFDQSSYCTVSITGGGATGKKINGVAGPIVVHMVNGQALLTVTATSVGTLILGLSAPSPAGLAVASTATITFS